MASGPSRLLPPDVDPAHFDTARARFRAVVGDLTYYGIIKDAFGQIPSAKFYTHSEHSKRGGHVQRDRHTINNGVTGLDEMTPMDWLPNAGHLAFSPVSAPVGTDALQQFHMVRERSREPACRVGFGCPMTSPSLRRAPHCRPWSSRTAKSPLSPGKPARPIDPNSLTSRTRAAPPPRRVTSRGDEYAHRRTPQAVDVVLASRPWGSRTYLRAAP